ncbi:hypothetical protein OIPHN330_28570 [Citrobacter freundii]|nr:hypothetical protein OIPHN330_28570 [Citrobacter freundii]BEJ40193.1 hypothetical protein OIPHN354_29050 [Citrobacter freundii]
MLGDSDKLIPDTSMDGCLVRCPCYYTALYDVIPIIKSLMQIKTYNHTGVTLEQS